MGRAGPAPQPGEILSLKDSSGARKRRGEVGIQPGSPEPPDWLSDAAAEQWSRMVDRLDHLQINSPGWRESLAQFCSLWAEYERLQKECDTAPTVISTKSGEKANPVFRLRDNAFDRAMKMGREFGYTPASKTMVRLGCEAKPSGKSKYFKGAG